MSRGGTAKRISAMMVGHSPCPPSGVSRSRTRTAKVGTARPTLETLTASVPPLPRWPSTSATGSAMRQLRTRHSAVSQRCSPSRCQMPFSPDQWAAEVSHDQASDERGHDGCRPRPGGQQPLDAEQQQIGGDGDQHAQDGRGEHLRLEVGVHPGVDQVAEPAVADDGADRHQGDRGDGGDAQPGHGGGQRRAAVPRPGAAVPVRSPCPGPPAGCPRGRRAARPGCCVRAASASTAPGPR